MNGNVDGKYAWTNLVIEVSFDESMKSVFGGDPKYNIRKQILLTSDFEDDRLESYFNWKQKLSKYRRHHKSYFFIKETRENRLGYGFFDRRIPFLEEYLFRVATNNKKGEIDYNTYISNRVVPVDFNKFKSKNDGKEFLRELFMARVRYFVNLTEDFTSPFDCNVKKELMKRRFDQNSLNKAEFFFINLPNNFFHKHLIIQEKIKYIGLDNVTVVHYRFKNPNAKIEKRSFLYELNDTLVSATDYKRDLEPYIDVYVQLKKDKKLLSWLKNYTLNYLGIENEAKSFMSQLNDLLTFIKNYFPTTKLL